MAYDAFLAERVESTLVRLGVDFEAKKMMGGLCFMVNGKMLCGPIYNKKRELHVLMIRVGEEFAQQALGKEGVYPMDFTGRTMKGYLFIGLETLDREEELDYWLKACLKFNETLKD